MDEEFRFSGWWERLPKIDLTVEEMRRAVRIVTIIIDGGKDERIMAAIRDVARGT